MPQIRLEDYLEVREDIVVECRVVVQYYREGKAVGPWRVINWGNDARCSAGSVADKEYR